MGIATAEVEIRNVMGIHLRPASSIVQIANQYPDCELTITKNGQSINGKSIMSVIMLAAEQGSILKLETQGPDCEKLLAALVALIEAGFGEE
jgi:phosphocarrier protein HPr